MQNQNPLNKVVFIQKVAAFTNTRSLKDLFRLAYVNNSWNDTIKNYAFHIFEKEVRSIKSINVLESVCECVIVCGVLWILNVVLLSETVIHRMNLPRLVCASASSPRVMNLVFDKVVELGGAVKLNHHLSAKDRTGANSLMLLWGTSASADSMGLVFEKILEVGGTDLLLSLLTVSNNRGWICLMFAAFNCPSSDVLKLLFQKIVEVGGTDLLKNQLAAKNDSRLNFFAIAINYSTSADLVKLVASLLVSLDMFDDQFENLDTESKNQFKLNYYDSSSSSFIPSPESAAQVNEILNCISR